MQRVKYFRKERQEDMPKEKKKRPKLYGTVWVDRDRRGEQRFEADEEEEGVRITLRRGMNSIAEGKGFLVNIGHNGAFVKAVFEPGTTFLPQDLIDFTVEAEGHLCGFSAEAHVRFRTDERRRVVGRDGVVDLNLAFCKVEKESEDTLKQWRGWGPNARKAVGRRRRKWR